MLPVFLILMNFLKSKALVYTICEDLSEIGPLIKEFETRLKSNSEKELSFYGQKRWLNTLKITSFIWISCFIITFKLKAEYFYTWLQLTYSIDLHSASADQLGPYIILYCIIWYYIALYSLTRLAIHPFVHHGPNL